MKIKKRFFIIPCAVLVLAAAGWELIPRLTGLEIFPPLSRTRQFQSICAAVSETGAFKALAALIEKLRPDSSPDSAGRNAAAVAVETADISVMPLRETGYFSGSLKARSQFILSTKVAARLERLAVDVGDTVKKGQIVAVLDNREYVAQVKQAQADLDVARANLRDAGNTLQTAKNELRRVRTLFTNKIASQTEKENAETAQRHAEVQYDVAQAQIRQKQAVLDTVKENLAATRMAAEWDSEALPPNPSSGDVPPPAQNTTRIVGERFVDPGALLKANDSVISIMDLSSLTATVNITETMYARMRVGLAAAAQTDAIPGKTFQGVVERIAPLLNQTSRQAEVRIGIPNESGELKPGMFVRVAVEYSHRENAVTVPVAALVRREEKDGVFLLSGDAKSVRFIPVTLGITDNGRVEIVAPPVSGKVITLGNHLLQDGSEVFIP
ncbi:MAG: efflux RND transporter periplasmic adaptor subunit [Spirochaetales bacterium]|jgi:multidrug efflux pump subunit AcrA (membrane-fusion protein)|nr:efflux RND transporter periplasmic adaptor subunit [Spirochaetales bacterium]